MAKRVRTKSKIAALLLPIVALIAAASWYLHRHTIAVLDPAGQIGQKERQLMIIALLLSAIVVVPVYIMTVVIALKYRESNHQRKRIKYSPDWDRSRLFEGIWWGIPLLIIAILSVVTWNSSHALDPYRALVSSKRPITVQVVALDWKWLFIYPQQHVASVNLVEFPKNTPVNFEITSDTVMNSFWIPQLGGQIYAMPGMNTQLHLIADRNGSFYGSPANIAGVGFARMTFTAKAVSQTAFNAWLLAAEHSSKYLDMASYQRLARPSEGVPVSYYSHSVTGLYNEVIVKYLTPYNSTYFVTPQKAQAGYVQ